MSLVLLDNHPFSDPNSSTDFSDKQSKGSKVDFLQQAKAEQMAEDVAEADTSVEEEEREGGSKRKKQKVDVYRFFLEMQQMGVRPLDKDKDTESME